MKTIKTLIRQTRRSLAGFIGGSEYRTDTMGNATCAPDLEHNVATAGKKPSLHELELAQHNRVQTEHDRRDLLNDSELRIDLEQQYGHTKWAKNLIDRVLKRRVDARDA